MHTIRLTQPALPLRGHVRWYAQRQVRLGSGLFTHPVAARAAPLITFDFGDPVRVHYENKANPEVTFRTGVVGTQTHRRALLLLEGVIDAFVILFHPTGLHRLFSIPMNELTDADYEAHSVLGRAVSSLEQHLCNCSTFAERVRVADEFLLARAVNGRIVSPIARAASEILLTAGNVRIPALANKAGLSTRQFERRFIEEVGAPPKLYGRIARFEAALDCKARSPQTSWADVAHQFGYHDQMHMVHDFEGFTGKTPMKVLGQIESVFREQIDAMRSRSTSTNVPADERLIF
jgi:AraC-like DNA-binding protein